MNLQTATKSMAAVGKTSFCIGVTGHRRNRMKQPDVDQVTTILSLLFNRLDTRSALPIRLLSGMADGADIAAAKARLDHWSLTMVLAAPAGSWGQQLAQSDASDHRQFSKDHSAATLIELSQGAPDYIAVADYLVAQSDLLVALWDGQSGKPGGTGSVVAKARAKGTPVLHIPFPMVGRCRIYQNPAQ